MRIVNCRYSDLETDTPQAEATDLFNISIPFIETSRAKPTETSTHPAPDTDLLNLSVSSWLERLSDRERDTYCDNGCMMTPGQRALCEVKKPCPKEINI